MKIAFISDIHGNAIALEAVLKDIENKHVDKIVVLGDLAYRGPEPKRSIELVKGLNTTVIKGNADEWIVRGVNQGEVPDKVLDLMNEERDWSVSQIDQADMDYLAQLPTEITLEDEGIKFHAFHATPTSLFDVVLPDAADSELESKLISAKDADVYLYGHIHKAYIRYVQGKTIINLGSIGLPFDGVTKASYAIVNVKDGILSTSIERVSYDYQKTIDLYDTVNYPNTSMMKNIVKSASINN
ncbi:metallophosphoesterase family protein [Aquibacillus rhizosphaerae]|uniref:Phosphoesterase n=1 Tax=Aquibacillus rhizosphaerae TaxID=3051431 RepID=A0ABT7L9W7_9BACI|nr:metallophosphoesterase family protein [Aquibacillus sp. LR5S19]MDL4842666.1 metallophosphoesterase family protein [Aquibacillus sp. LR5S19]